MILPTKATASVPAGLFALGKSALSKCRSRPRPSRIAGILRLARTAAVPTYNVHRPENAESRTRVSGHEKTAAEVYEGFLATGGKNLPTTLCYS